MGKFTLDWVCEIPARVSLGTPFGTQPTDPVMLISFHKQKISDAASVLSDFEQKISNSAAVPSKYRQKHVTFYFVYDSQQHHLANGPKVLRLRLSQMC